MDGRCMMMDGWWIDNGWMDDVWIMDGWMIDGWLMDEWLMDGYIHYGWWLDGWLKGDGWMMDGCLVKGLMDEWMDAWWIHDGWMDDDHTGWHNPSWHMHFFMWHLPQNRSSLFCILFPFLYRKWYIYNTWFFFNYSPRHNPWTIVHWACSVYRVERGNKLACNPRPHAITQRVH